MSELQDNVLDDQNSDYTDLESLLAVANSSEFSVSDGFTTEKQEFEKFNSFFEIVTSNETKNLDNEDEVLLKKVNQRFLAYRLEARQMKKVN